MIVTIQKWKKKVDWSVDYDSEPIVKKIHGSNAADCMASVLMERNYNDLTKYTPVEIISIED